MAMPLATPPTPGSKGWTVDMLREIPDDLNRYEIIDGELFVSPSPSWRHGDAALVLIRLLDPYLIAHRIGHLKTAPQDVEFDRRNLVGPDLFVVPFVDGKVPKRWEDVRRLLLVIEILSPSTARADRLRKRTLDQREDAAEYWIVDVDARVVERWRPGDERPEMLDRSISWRPDPAAPALEIDLLTFFSEVTGESG